MTALQQYSWPGNIRELENFIERAVILSQTTDLEVPVSELKRPTTAADRAAVSLEDAERQHILKALHEARWIIGGQAGAAAKLGIKRTTLNSKMQKLGISRLAVAQDINGALASRLTCRPRTAGLRGSPL